MFRNPLLNKSSLVMALFSELAIREADQSAIDLSFVEQ